MLTKTRTKYICLLIVHTSVMPLIGLIILLSFVPTTLILMVFYKVTFSYMLEVYEFICDLPMEIFKKYAFRSSFQGSEECDIQEAIMESKTYELDDIRIQLDALHNKTDLLKMDDPQLEKNHKLIEDLNQNMFILTLEISIINADLK